MTEARVIFAGTPGFALESLRALVGAGVRPVAVLTQPDRPKGRGRKLAASPVKQYAIEQGLPVLQPTSLKDAAVQDELRALEADLCVVAAYGLLFPQAVLDIPRLGCVNVHASLLPRWRGAAPIQAAILAGDAETGVCLMQMEAGLDSGPVFARASLPIGDSETAGELHDRLALLGGQLLAEHVEELLGEALVAVEQDPSQVTHAGKIASADAALDWRKPALELERQVRAYNPVPGARFDCDGEMIKVWRAAVVDGSGAAPGTVLSADRAIEIACGDGVLALAEVQRAGRNRITAAQLADQLELSGRRLPLPAG